MTHGQGHDTHGAHRAAAPLKRGAADRTIPTLAALEIKNWSQVVELYPRVSSLWTGEEQRRFKGHHNDLPALVEAVKDPSGDNWLSVIFFTVSGGSPSAQTNGCSLVMSRPT